MLKTFPRLFIFCVLTTAFYNYCWSEEASAKTSKIVSETNFSNVQVTEMTLSNGMRIYLKPTKLEEDEILVQISALGGFASLPKTSRASAEIAPRVGIDSGLGSFSGDQLHALFYDYSLEFLPQIKAFNRVIEGSTAGDSVALFFKLVNWVFTRPHFDSAAFQQVLTETKNSLQKRKVDPDVMFDNSHLALNTSSYSPLRLLTLEELSKANFELAQQIYLDSFSNPADFSVVIVGDFDPQVLKELIVKYLATIPNKEATQPAVKDNLPKFPSGVTSKIVFQGSDRENISRMTFPILITLTEEKMHCLDLVTELLETKLREIFKKKYGETLGVDVGYEFPLYPSPQQAWLVVQFISNLRQTTEIKKIILTELIRFQNEEVSQEIINEGRKSQKASDEFWMRENSYWVTALSNYALWHWSPDALQPRDDQLKCLNPANIRHVFNTFFSSKNFTLISKGNAD